MPAERRCSRQPSIPDGKLLSIGIPQESGLPLSVTDVYSYFRSWKRSRSAIHPETLAPYGLRGGSEEHVSLVSIPPVYSPAIRVGRGKSTSFWRTLLAA